MSTSPSFELIGELPGYATLQREMHDALRAQHPEWIEPNGDSPMCDLYEARFAHLLGFSLLTQRTHQQSDS